MSKRVRRNDQDYLRFQPYRAIVASPLKRSGGAQNSFLKKSMLFAGGGLLLAALIYLLQQYLPVH